MKPIVMKWINTAWFVVMIAVTALANILPIGVGNTGEVSVMYPNLFSPAPVTFGIWLIIYLFMAFFVVFQWEILDEGKYSKEVVSAVGPWFSMSCLLNTAWIFVWHFNVIWLSLILIAALLASVTVIVKTISKANVSGKITNIVKIGFDIYFGWLIAATIANISVYLVSIGWNGFGISQTVWTVIILIIGAFIGLAVSGSGDRWAASLAMVWAYVGILIKHIGQSGYVGRYPAVITAAFIGIMILLIPVCTNIMCRKQCNSTSKEEEAEEAE